MTKTIYGSFLKRILAMAVNKKIVVDQNLHEIIPSLKKVGISHVWDISKLKLNPNQSTEDKEIIRRLKEEGKQTKNSQFLFITNNEKDFLNPKEFDVLVVPQNSNDANMIATIKAWLTSSVIKQAQNKVFRVYKTTGAGDYGYVITDKILSKPKRKSLT